MNVDQGIADLQRARVLLDLHRNQEALEKSGGHLARHPDSVPAMQLTIRALAALGRTHDALQVAGRAVAVAPNDPYCWQLQALSLIQVHRWDEAMAAATRMCELRPNDAELLDSYATCAFHAGRLEAARAAGEQALRLRPDDPDYLTGLAKIELAQRQPDAARQHLAAALAISPDHADARRVLATVPAVGREQATVDLARMVGSAPQDELNEAYFEAAASRLLVRPALIVLAACAAVLAAAMLGHGWLGTVLQLLAIVLGGGVLLLWARRSDVRLGGLGRTLVRNRLGNGPMVTFVVLFLGLAAILLILGWIVGAFWADPAGPIVVAAAAISAFTGVVLAGLLHRFVRTSGRTGYGVLIPVAIALCLPGIAIMVVALAAGFVLMVIYIVLSVVTGGKLFPLPAWLRSDKR